MTAPPLPPLPVLRDMFSYNPLTGVISYLQQRGPRGIGEPAGASIKGTPRLYVNNRYCRAAAVAWALAHGADPAPQHVVPADGDPFNLRLINLQLSPEPFRRSNLSPGQRKRRPRWIRQHCRYSRARGVWIVWHNRRNIGEYSTLMEAALAKRAAINADKIHSHDSNA